MGVKDGSEGLCRVIKQARWVICGSGFTRKHQPSQEKRRVLHDNGLPGQLHKTQAKENTVKVMG